MCCRHQADSDSLRLLRREFDGALLARGGAEAPAQRRDRRGVRRHLGHELRTLRLEVAQLLEDDCAIDLRVRVHHHLCLQQLASAVELDLDEAHLPLDLDPELLLKMLQLPLHLCLLLLHSR